MFTQRYIAATLTCNHLQLLRIYDSEDGVYCHFFIIIGRRACRKATFTWDRGHPHSASRNPKHPKPLQGGPTPAQVRMFVVRILVCWATAGMIAVIEKKF